MSRNLKKGIYSGGHLAITYDPVKRVNTNFRKLHQILGCIIESFGAPAPPQVTKGAQKKKKEKERERREEKEEREKKKEGETGEKKGGGTKKREKIERQISISREALFTGGFKVDAGSTPPPILCKDRASDFVWAPQAKNNAPNPVN